MVVMTTLPAAIETSLLEAGFTATEILVLKRLLAEDALTMRELALKTGKSTGVLDQAMKKLVSRDIVCREEINGQPKYSISSMDAIIRCMEEEMEARREELKRKHESFEQYIASLTHMRERPEMKHFRGFEGIKQAYVSLLQSGKEHLRYAAVAEELTPSMQEFQAQYFRMRKTKDIPCRVIAQDTPDGRKFQTRDPFEHRQTRLIAEGDVAISYDKIICGDIVACFNHPQNYACFLQYPDLANAERAQFENFWRMAKREKKVEPEVLPAAPKGPKTTILPNAKKFFWGRKSLITMGALAVLSATLTTLLYAQYVSLNTKRVQERVKSIAATAALQFDIKDLAELRTVGDISKPQYKKVIDLLNKIRKENEGVRYAYIMRPTSDPMIMEFVADADALDPFTPKDLDGNGIIDDADKLSSPGEKYSVGESPFDLKQSSYYKPYTDQYGTVITGSAPIKNPNGNTVALLGVDINASTVSTLTLSAFKPWFWFFGILGCLLLIRLIAFHKELGKDIVTIIGKRTMIILAITTVLSAVLTYGLYRQNIYLNTQRIREKAMSVAATGALQFISEELDQIHTKADIIKPEYSKIIKILNEIRNQNPGVRYIYIYRASDDTRYSEMVADADSINPDEPQNLNNNGIVEPFEENIPPGQKYALDQAPRMRLAIDGIITAEEKPYSDQWGTWISGFAPIKGGKKPLYLGVDISASQIQELTQSTFKPLIWFVIIYLVTSIIGFAGFHRGVLIEALKLLKIWKVRIALLCSFFIVLILSASFAFYNKEKDFEQMREKLISIAATGALQFSAEELDELKNLHDAQKPVYEQVVKKLIDIRKQNDNIIYVYLIRPKNNSTIFEFIADADSPDPFARIDSNHDGQINNADEMVFPGRPYDTSHIDIFKNGLPLGSTATHEPYTDQWGTVITGYSPIKDSSGQIVGLLCIDIEISK